MKFIARICAICGKSKSALGGKLIKRRGMRVWICKACVEEQ